jgi:MFS family permease
MKQYLQLLEKEYILKRLSIIQLIAYFGAWFSNIAIYTLLIQMDVSADIIAFVAMLHFFSGVLQAPLSGAIIDAMAPKKLMLILVVIQIFATFGLIFVENQEDLWMLYLLVFIKMAAASFYFTTEMSLLPRILHGKDLQLANELHSIIWSLSYTVGMALSGYFVYLFGVAMAFVVDGLLFCVAYFILYNTQLHVAMEEKTQHLFGMMQEIFVYFKKEPLVVHLMVIHAFVGFSAFDALVALLVDNLYQFVIAASLSLGLMHSFRAFGLVLGPVVLSKWINKKNLFSLFLFEALAVGIWSMVMDHFYLSLVASIAVGFFTTTLWSYTYTLIQKNVHKQFYGRIVAYNDMLFLFIASFSSFMIGFLAKHGWALHNIGYMMGLMFVIGAIYYAKIYKKYAIKG